MTRVSRRSPGCTADSTTPQRPWGLPAQRHCAMTSGNFAEDERKLGAVLRGAAPGVRSSTKWRVFHNEDVEGAFDDRRWATLYTARPGGLVRPPTHSVTHNRTELRWSI